MRRHLSVPNLLGCGLALLYLWVIQAWITTNDFHVYYDAASALQHGRPLYEVPSYIYSPLFAWLLQPLAWLSLGDARIVWYLLQIVAVTCFTIITIAISGSAVARRYWGLVLLAVMISTPTYWDLVLGQVGILMALLIIASYALSRRHPRLAGLLLGLAAIIKVYPALLWLYYLATRRRAAVWTVIAGAGLVLFSLLVCGLDLHIAFVQALAGGSSYPYAAEHNNSIVSFWLRMWSVNPFVPPLLNAPLIGYILIGLSILLVIATCLRSGLGPIDDAGQHAQFSIWLCAMLLLSPANGMYNLMLLLVPLLAMFARLEHHHDRPILRGLMIALALQYLPLATSVFSIPSLQAQRWISLVFTPPFYGIVLCFALAVVLTGRHGTRFTGTLRRYEVPDAVIRPSPLPSDAYSARDATHHP